MRYIFLVAAVAFYALALLVWLFAAYVFIDSSGDPGFAGPAEAMGLRLSAAFVVFLAGGFCGMIGATMHMVYLMDTSNRTVNMRIAKLHRTVNEAASRATR